MLLYIIRNILGDKYMKKEVGFENRDRFVELGLMISALRKAKGYTQYELAEKAHISRSHLSSIEAPNITSSFSLEVFFNIADILEVKPGDLLNLNLPSSYFINKESGKMYLKRLRTLRLSSGLKQTDIAKILGIQQTVYSRYERGFQTIPLHFLVKLADFYNTSTDYTLNRTNEKNPR